MALPGQTGVNAGVQILIRVGLPPPPNPPQFPPTTPVPPAGPPSLSRRLFGRRLDAQVLEAHVAQAEDVPVVGAVAEQKAAPLPRVSGPDWMVRRRWVQAAAGRCAGQRSDPAGWRCRGGGARPACPLAAVGRTPADRAPAIPATCPTGPGRGSAVGSLAYMYKAQSPLA